MKIKFTKMQALGNDFVIIDAVRQKIALTPKIVRHLANRRLGIGCDQVLLVEKPKSKNAEFFYRIFNADGSKAEQCGNGARCFAKFVSENGLTKKQAIKVETVAGNIELFLEDDGEVTVDMGLPILPKNEDEKQSGVVSMGNQHMVLQAKDLNNVDVEYIGKTAAKLPFFKNGINVEFMQVVSKKQIKLRVYERGVGETPACGSGACAAVVMGRLWNMLDAKVLVKMPGGNLQITWLSRTSRVFMKGPATKVFEGIVDIMYTSRLVNNL